MKTRSIPNLRRELLKYGLAMTAAGVITRLTDPISTQVFGAENAGVGKTNGKKFLVHVHVGSWDGWHSGILMPNQAGEFPQGVFETGAKRLSANPGVNEHETKGCFVLNAYTKVLEPITKNCMFGVVNPQSLSHRVGDLIQCTGSEVTGTAGLPSWAMGFAHRMSELASTPTSIVVEPSPSVVTNRGRVAKRATSISASNVPEFLKSRVDAPHVLGTTEMHERFLNLLATQNVNGTGGKEWENASKSYSTGMGSFSKPNSLDPNSPLVGDIANAIKESSVRTILSAIDDKANTEGHGLALTPKFQLAAALIESKQASAFAVHLDASDIHDGDSSGHEARYGAVVFSQIRNFWEWVMSKGLQEDVMVLVTQEFSRSPWALPKNPGDPMRKYGSSVFHKGETKQIESWGTDHHLVAGVMALHGSFTEPARMGCVGDGYIPMAGSDLKGGSRAGLPHTITEMVGSLMMRCFPNEFPDALAVHNVWFNFRDGSVLKPLVNG